MRYRLHTYDRRTGKLTGITNRTFTLRQAEMLTAGNYAHSNFVDVIVPA